MNGALRDASPTDFRMIHHYWLMRPDPGIEQVARMSAAICGRLKNPGCRFTHPGYAHLILPTDLLFECRPAANAVI
jgi:hypothetical protein